jgi:hypothetical protein
MKNIFRAIFVLCWLLIGCALTTTISWADEPTWINVTNDLGGNAEDWGKFTALTLGVEPGTDNVYVHVGSAGLFTSKDAGEHWVNIAPTGASKIDGFIGNMLFDPADGKTFWVTCWYGTGLLKTTDGGMNFLPLGSHLGMEGISVDFTDPHRRMIVIGGHEKAQSLQLSQDGGTTWKAIGQNLPPDTNYSCWPVLAGPSIITNTSGGGKNRPNIGIWRSSDAGATWTKVSDLSVTGPPLLTTKGDIFYPVKGGLARSMDNGMTWSVIATSDKGSIVVGAVIELPDGRLAGKGFGGGHIQISSDRGDSWSALGPNLPPNVGGFGQSRSIVYLPGRKAFMISVGSYLKKTQNAVWRLDVPNL